ncbi:MAG: 4Fe-4S binding protein, partial [Gammaproteobacteria bacterium]|nr:4Fe-4S binding protein [Gammaproteobacteria bacterium]
AVSQPPANLAIVPAVIDFDWFYLAAYPLLDRLPGLTMWAVAGGSTLLLLALPWLPPLRRKAAAVVDLDNCNGCGRCVEDCPFSAVSLQPRTDGAAFSEEAIVSSNLCTSCGICVGACPTSTPFRRTTELVPGIDLPDQSMRALREKTLAISGKLAGTARVIVYGCAQGPDLGQLENDSTGVITLPCIAQLPPAFIDFVISRRHAEGVFLTGCTAGDCHYRLGQQWEDQRLAGERDPYLRKRVPAERLGKYWAGITGNKRLQQELVAFHDRLKGLPPLPQRTPHPVDKTTADRSESHG